MDPFDAQALGPYTLIAPLAHGGMGAVYFAVQTEAPTPRRLITVKTLKANLVGVEDYAGRFNDEAKVALRLRHENLCEVFDAGVAGDTFYLAMEAIEGVTLRRLQTLMQAKKWRLRPVEAAALAVGLLRGLHAAHVATDENGRALGVVHRDVSPHNAMLDINGHVRVIDYGLATSVLKETFTESLVALGKAAYMPPEQARGEDVTAAGDQYAAAIVLYELFTADRFYGELNSRAIWGVVGSGVHQPRKWNSVPEAFRAVLQKALAPQPSDRHESCAAFADALVAVDPRAADSRELHGVHALLHELAPAELEAVAAARAALTRLEEVTERTPLTKAALGDTVVNRPAPGPDETAATVIRRDDVAAPKRSRAPLLAAAGVALCGVAAAFAAPAALRHNTPATVAGITPAALVGAPRATAPAHAALVDAAGLAATHVAPDLAGNALVDAAGPHGVVDATATSSATTAAHESAARGSAAGSARAASSSVKASAARGDGAGAKPGRGDDDKRREKLAKRADGDLARLSPTCPLVLVVGNARAQIDHADLNTFEEMLRQAEQECSPR